MRLSDKKLTLLSLSALAGILFFCQQGYSQEASAKQMVAREVNFHWVNLSLLPSVDDAKDPKAANPAPGGKNPSTQSPKVATYSLTPGAKLKNGFHRAFLSPGTYFFPGIATLRQQLDEDEPAFKDRGDKAADALSRYAINFGTASTKNLFSYGIYPIVFKQNPHYVPSGKQGFRARLLYAASRVFVTYGDDGNSQFNASLLAGDITASALANLWERSYQDHNRIGAGPTFRRFGAMVGFDILRFIIANEFGPDIKRMVLRK